MYRAYRYKCTYAYGSVRTAPYCSVLLRTAPYWYVWYSTVMVLYPGTSMYVRGEVGMDGGNSQDAIPDACAKAARRLSQIRLRLGDDLHRREGAEELLARDGALGCM